MQSQMTFESMMQHIMTIRDGARQQCLPLPELRANSETIAVIGHAIKEHTDQINYPYTLSVPATIYGMTIDIDESVPNGEIRPIYLYRVKGRSIAIRSTSIDTEASYAYP